MIFIKKSRKLTRTSNCTQSGRLSVTEKSLRPTEASVRLIAQCLVAPDFDAEVPRAASGSHGVEATGSYRAHAWGVLVQQCGWAKPRRGVLILT